MDYCRKNNKPLESVNSTPCKKNYKTKLIVLSITAIILLAGCAISAALLVHYRNKGSKKSEPIFRPTQAISKTCNLTRYPTLCVNSLVNFPGSLVANEQDLVGMSVNMTLQRVRKALDDATLISNLEMDTRVRSSYENCLEMLDDSVDLLSRALSLVGPNVGVSGDVMTWLSAALTNQDTCMDGFRDENDDNHMKDQMEEHLRDVWELISNCLAIFSVMSDYEDFSGISTQDGRNLLESGLARVKEGGKFPVWVVRKDRRLLRLPLSAFQADFVVSLDGNGTHRTIGEAINAAPRKSSRRIIIYIRTGRYEENELNVSKDKTNLMFIGEGKGKTIISGGKNADDGLRTFHTASFAAKGDGFIARDITFENWAGPYKHQAVALLVKADQAVVYQCEIIGYQDTLYVHSKRQFFRECDIYGTVDFIFGNAAVVIQNCNIYARMPMAKQKNTITAQGRSDPHCTTGISIHNCRIAAASDLNWSNNTVETYLGRPWKMYSRVVYMTSYLGDHIDPQGWLKWNDTFAFHTLYYGEYMNYGHGAGVEQRVKWPGYHVITSKAEASMFTVGHFINGSSWLPSAGVAFNSSFSR